MLSLTATPCLKTSLSCPPPVQASAAVPVGFIVFIVAWVILIVIAFGFPYRWGCARRCRQGFACTSPPKVR